MKAVLKAIFLILTVSVVHTTSLMSFEQYQIINLGLQDYKSSRVTSVNDKGWISGIVNDGSYNYIFVLDENKKMAKRYERMDTARPLINNNNEVFGSLITRTQRGDWIFDEEVVYKWENPFNYFQYFNFYQIGRPDGQWSGPYNFKSTVVWDVNDLGQILVMNNPTISSAIDELSNNSVWVYDDKLKNDALWFQDGFHKIEDPNFTAGYKINNHSQILGSTLEGSKIDRNRMERVSVYNFAEESLRVLDFPDASWGYDINDNGQVVGGFYDPNDDIIKGFLAEPTGQVIEISNLDPDLISNQGDVFGTYIYGQKKNQPAMWKDGQTVDFKELVNLVDDMGNTWDSIGEIVDVNNKGYLIGNGKIKGVRHGFLLKPISQN
ncbi:MAG: hypothetical protein H0T62_12000 [Parachlamydiaceae bacterium]|nr:hypothetical protein [Parachlamydiaceae bacterium]